MQLSNRASKYLDKLHRDQEYTCSRELVVDYLQKNKLPAFEQVASYQTEISGYSLTVGGKPSKSFIASLFSAHDIREGLPIETVHLNQKHYFFCGEQPTAPFTFILSEDGEICSYDGYGEEVNPIYSSGELLIENFALIDYLSIDAVELPQYFELKDSEGLENLMAGHGHFSRANDKYNTWYITDNAIVHKGTWLERPEYYVHIYGKALEDAHMLRDKFKKQAVISQ